MKKSVVVVCVFLIVLLGSIFVSASWWGDITGRVTACVQDDVICSDGTVVSANPDKGCSFDSCPDEMCFDSDGGTNYFIRGSTFGLESSDVWDNFEDYCETIAEEEGKLIEYFCNEETNYVEKLIYDCANPNSLTPSECFEGACIKIEPIEEKVEEEKVECDALICQNGALFYQKEESLLLLEDCQFGCNEGRCGEDMSYKDFDNPIVGTCLEAIPGHNNLSENRINVGFVGFNYDNLEIFQFLVDSVIDSDSNYYGLLSVEPFKSNKDKFNFWYVDEIQNIEGVNLMAEVSKLTKKIRTFKIACNYTNLYPIGLVNEDGGGFAPGEAGLIHMDDKPAKWGDFPSCELSDLNNDGCVDEKDLKILERDNLEVDGFLDCQLARYGCDYDTLPEDNRVFYYSDEIMIVVHEFGHSFGSLLDEYNNLGGNFEGTDIIKGNCFTASSKEECLANTPWKDLLGRGCGDGSLVDCIPKDENYSFEVGCFEGCMYVSSGIYRPTFSSIMGTGIRYGSYSYGLVNERFLCQKIIEKTGSAGGYCNQFGIITTEEEDDFVEIFTEEENDLAEVTTKEVSLVCNGCKLNDKCYPFNHREDGKYCNVEQEFVPQLEADAACDNNFECFTNLCIDGRCVSSGVWQRFLGWLDKLFG